jgi:hypothetical protein
VHFSASAVDQHLENFHFNFFLERVKVSRSNLFRYHLVETKLIVIKSISVNFSFGEEPEKKTLRYSLALLLVRRFAVGALRLRQAIGQSTVGTRYSNKQRFVLLY